MSTFETVELTSLRIGDVVEDSYANPAIVINIRPTPQGSVPSAHQVTIMQLVGSDRGRTGGLPQFIRRATDPEYVERCRELGREVWREKAARASAGRRTR